MTKAETFFTIWLYVNLDVVCVVCGLFAVKNRKHVSTFERCMTGLVVFCLWPAALVTMAFKWLLEHD